MFVVHRIGVESSLTVAIIPETCQVLSAGLGGNGLPSLWYSVDVVEPESFQVLVVDNIPTGQMVGCSCPKHFLGTVNVGGKVSHLFRRTHLPLISMEKALSMKEMTPVQVLDELAAMMVPA